MLSDHERPSPRLLDRPGRLTPEQVHDLRALYAAARRTHDWAELAVAFNRLLGDGVPQTRIGMALGVSASHVHDIESTHLPADHHGEPARDWSAGDWVGTPAAARLLNISSTRLTRRLSDADDAAITCRAGRRRVWHADSLADWWDQTG